MKETQKLNKQQLDKQQLNNQQQKILFQDKDVKITNKNVQIKWYFFPIGTSKVIQYRRIQKIQVRPLSTAGSWRLWGMSATQWGYWLPGDKSRPNRNQFIAIYNDSSVTPSLTTQNTDLVYKILCDQLQKYRKAQQ